jgi:hypothetical protein
LGVPVVILEDWLAGRTDIPDVMLISLLDLLDEILDGSGQG